MDTINPFALVTCLIDMHFSPSDVESAAQLLLSTVGRTEAQPGCLSCRLTRDEADENRFRYHETWDSMTAFQRHVQSDEFRLVLVAMDMCCEVPDVMVGDLSARSGMAYLQDLRKGAA